MPRRNRNGRYQPDDADRLVASTALMPAECAISDAKYPCAGCRRRGHWAGEYCPLCKGKIMLSGHKNSLTRR